MSRRPPSNYDLIAKLEYVLTHTRDLQQWADDWAEGFPAGGDSGPQSKGGHSDRTSSAVIAPDTPCPVCRGETPCAQHPNPKHKVWAQREGHGLSDQAQNTLNNIEAARTLINHAANQLRHLQSMGAQAAQLRTRPEQTTPGAGWCNVDRCDTYCTGAKNDCIVTGMCPTCYRAWRRTVDNNEHASLTVFRTTWTPRAKQGAHTP